MSDAPKKSLLGIFVAATLLFAGTSVYFYAQYAELRANPNKIAQDSTRDLVAKVGQLMVLPEGETPTVATVTDPSKLKDQPFFANTQEGDRVLIYTNARKAVLYNPSSNRIVEVAPLSFEATGAAKTAPTTPEKSVK